MSHLVIRGLGLEVRIIFYLLLLSEKNEEKTVSGTWFVKIPVTTASG